MPSASHFQTSLVESQSHHFVCAGTRPSPCAFPWSNQVCHNCATKSAILAVVCWFTASRPSRILRLLRIPSSSLSLRALWLSQAQSLSANLRTFVTFNTNAPTTGANILASLVELSTTYILSVQINTDMIPSSLLALAFALSCSSFSRHYPSTQDENRWPSEIDWKSERERRELLRQRKCDARRNASKDKAAEEAR